MVGGGVGGSLLASNAGGGSGFGTTGSRGLSVGEDGGAGTACRGVLSLLYRKFDG